MHPKTINDLDEMLASVRAIKGRDFCSLVQIETSLVSLGEMIMSMARSLNDDPKAIESVQKVFDNVHGMIMAELCNARNINLDQAEEISDWTNRLFEKIESNHKRSKKDR